MHLYEARRQIKRDAHATALMIMSAIDNSSFENNALLLVADTNVALINVRKPWVALLCVHSPVAEQCVGWFRLA